MNRVWPYLWLLYLLGFINNDRLMIDFFWILLKWYRDSVMIGFKKKEQRDPPIKQSKFLVSFNKKTAVMYNTMVLKARHFIV